MSKSIKKGLSKAALALATSGQSEFKINSAGLTGTVAKYDSSS